MKVSMLTTIGDRCGVATYASTLASSISDRVDLNLVPIEAGSHDPDEYRRLADALNEADVIHIQHEYAFFGGIMPGRSQFHHLLPMLRRPVVLTAHTTYTVEHMLRQGRKQGPHHRAAKWLVSHWRPYTRLIEVEPYSHGHVIVHTRQAADALAGRGIAPGLVHVIPAGIPAAYPTPADPAAFGARIDALPGPALTVFGFVNQFKGYETALDALLRLPDSVWLLIAGGTRTPEDEPYLKGLLEHADRLGVGNRIRITGFLTEPDIAAAMSLTAIALVPHFQATGSYSVAFALAYSRPVIASDLPCFREIAEDGGGVLLTPPGDPVKLAAVIRRLMEAPGERQGLVTKTDRYIAERSWETAAARTVDVYGQALR